MLLVNSKGVNLFIYSFQFDEGLTATFLSILQFWEGSLRAEVLSCNSLYEVVRVVCLSPGLQPGKQTNYATDKPRHANDLVNAKSDAREKPLLAGYWEGHR